MFACLVLRAQVRHHLLCIDELVKQEATVGVREAWELAVGLQEGLALLWGEGPQGTGLRVLDPQAGC